jgi:SSS family solute:Na+ symporter
VNLTQKWQMAVIFGGMITAMFVVLPLPDEDLGPPTPRTSPAPGQAEAVRLLASIPRCATRCGAASLGGFFLSLSYFGTDQSQVQRYIGGASLREGRLGLMFNAVLKIPMQFFILLLGALLFRVLPVPARCPVSSIKPSGAAGEPVRTARRSAPWRKARRAPRREAGENPRLVAEARPAATPPPRPPPAPRSWRQKAATDAVRAEARDTAQAADPACQEDEGFRLRLHHLHPDAAPARRDRSARRRDVRLGPRLQGRRTQRPRHHHHH